MESVISFFFFSIEIFWFSNNNVRDTVKVNATDSANINKYLHVHLINILGVFENQC
jgi:hypothetical protein